ncbi:MAG: hypothetical protein IKA12_01535 [Clostridia bacterium]|nr:hypothetical protein [Clostridia bacterium]
MKIKLVSKICILLGLIIVPLTAAGVFATWKYASPLSYEQNYDLKMVLAEDVHIVEASFSEGKGGGDAVVNGFIREFLNSTAKLTTVSTSTATLKLKVYNNARETYAYNAVKYHAEQYDNVDIVVKPSIEHGDMIAPGEYLEFDVTFSYKKGITPSNTILNSYLEFDFVPLDKLPPKEEIAVDGALAQFELIINDVNDTGSFTKLLNQMDDGANNNRNDSYIGNVEGATDSDTELLAELFQGNLKLNIDGVDTDVTVIIKREDVDGNANTGDAEGREMAIYLTTDGLNRIFSSAPVYVAVFTSDDDGNEWYQLGQMYEGTANVVGYGGNIFGTGSFNTDTWKSTNRKTIQDLIKAL